MQWDFETNYAHLDIQLLGVNEYGYHSGNGLIPGPVNATSIPWIQDVDENGDSNSDVWTDWQVTYRDVVILDEENVPTGTFNLTTHGLHIQENYFALRQLFVNAATTTGADFDEDEDIDGTDFLAWQIGYAAPGVATHADGDADGNAQVDAFDLAIWQNQFGQAQLTPTASFTLTPLETVPEPGTFFLLLSIFPLLAYRWTL